MRFSLFLVLLAGLILPGCGLLGPADDTRAPLVDLTRPGDGAVVGGDVLLRFTGEARGDDNFISFITVSVDGERVGEADLITPGANPVFAYRLNSAQFSDGQHRIQATAFDKNENRGLSNTATLTFLNGVVDGVPIANGPLAAITSPRSGEEVTGTTQIIVQADPNQPAITRVDFLVDGVSLQTVTGFPFTYSWNTALEPVGLHLLQARVYSAPDRFRLTAPVTVQVNAPDDGDGGTNGCATEGCVRVRATGFRGRVAGSIAVGFNNDLYLGTDADTLYALSPAGTLRWKRGVQGRITSSPVVSNTEDIFVTSSDGRLHAFTPTGAQLWAPIVSPFAISGGPALGIDGTLYFGDDAGQLWAVNSFSGRVRDGFPVAVNASTSGTAIVGPPVIARDGTIFVASNGGSVFGINPNGTVKWRQTSFLSNFSRSLSLVEREVTRQLITGPVTEIRTTVYGVFLAGSQVSLYALSGDDGAVQWNEPIADPTSGQISTPIVDADGSIYLGTNRALLAFNETLADNQTSRLRFSFPAANVGTPAVDAGGTIHFVSAQTLRSVNPNGTPNSTYDLTATARGPLTIGRNGVVYVAADNELLSGINTGTAGLSEGKWPMFQRNSRHTGRIGVDSDD